MEEVINITWNDLHGDGKSITQSMVALTKDAIDDHVPTGIMPGNYTIGRLVGTRLNIIYAGRVDYRQDDGLKDRLKEHVGEWPGQLYFYWSPANSVKNSYETECRDYHFWLNYEGKLENEIHPRKPDGLDYKCPVCGL